MSLDQRLEAYFATLRSSCLNSTLKRKMSHWQVYAAVSGSAMAMATGASASLITAGDANTQPATASVRVSKPLPSGSNSPPFLNPKATQTQDPSIAPGGVVPIFGSVSIIQPGEWVSIYGSNLAATTASWTGNFPTSLAGTSVTIDGKPAYLVYVSPGQINLQAPDDLTTGPVPVVVTTPAGQATSTVTLSPYAPAFSLLPKSHVCGIILRSNGTGLYGGGTYDILGPDGNSLGFPTVAAQPGDIVELFGVGFGPTNPAVPAGSPFTGAAPITNTPLLYINNVFVTPAFVGLSSAGLYQINLVVPNGLGQGDVPIQAVVAGMQTQSGVLFSLKIIPIVSGTNGGTYNGGPYAGSGGNGFVGGSGGGTGGGMGGGTGGGTGGGGGSDAAHPKKPYHPHLRFAPQ